MYLLAIRENDEWFNIYVQKKFDWHVGTYEYRAHIQPTNH